MPIATAGMSGDALPGPRAGHGGAHEPSGGGPTGAPGRRPATHDDPLPVGLMLVPQSSRGRRTLTRVLQEAVVVFGSVDADRRPSVAAVAERVGISPAAIYQYFPDREALVRAATESDLAAMLSEARETVAGEPFAVITGSFSRAVHGVSAAHPLGVRALVSERVDVTQLPRVMAEFDQLVAALRTDLEVGRAAGLVRDDADIAELARSVLQTMLHSAVPELLVGGPDSPRYHAAEYVTLCAIFYPLPDVSSPAARAAFEEGLRSRLRATA